MADPTGLFPRFTDRAKKILELALKEAVRLDHPNIDVEHLSLAIEKEKEITTMAEQDNTPQDLPDVAPTRDRETGALISPPEEVPAPPAEAPVSGSDASDPPGAAVDEVPESSAGEAPAPQQSSEQPAEVEGRPIPSALEPTNWAPVHDALDIVETYLNGLRTKVAELRAFAQQESSKSA